MSLQASSLATERLRLAPVSYELVAGRAFAPTAMAIGSRSFFQVQECNLGQECNWRLSCTIVPPNAGFQLTIDCQPLTMAIE